MKRLMRSLLACLCLMPAIIWAQTKVVVKDDISANTTWTAGNEYHLDGLVFVNSGATLTIQPGTVIKGIKNPTTGDFATALIIRRGAKIMAEGRVDAPIIFTAELDDVSDPKDLLPTDGGLWGGVVILGKATTSNPVNDKQVEGIPADLDAKYGGSDDNDNSGVLKYVSIRHGGAVLNTSGNEINGLTLGAVGRGTKIEYVEVYSNTDDCFEMFGGTVDMRYITGSFCEDDTFDWDEGFRGRGQYWFSLNRSDISGRGGEHDGGPSGNFTGQPYSMPVISNATFIGSGIGSNPGNDKNDFALKFRDFSGGKYLNTIFTDFPSNGVSIEEVATKGGDSKKQLEDGNLLLKNNLWWNIGSANTTLAAISKSTPFVEAHLTANANSIVDPMLGGISRLADGKLDPRPKSANSPILTTKWSDPGESFFDKQDFIGAFRGKNWLNGWSALSTIGHLGNLTSVATETNEVPETMVLEQNYPNPFNPTTTIRFSLVTNQVVHLAVYDLAGRKIADLANGTFGAGNHHVTFDATGLASGMYIYRLETARKVFTRKMALLK